MCECLQEPTDQSVPVLITFAKHMTVCHCVLSLLHVHTFGGVVVAKGPD